MKTHRLRRPKLKEWQNRILYLAVDLDGTISLATHRMYWHRSTDRFILDDPDYNEGKRWRYTSTYEEYGEAPLNVTGLKIRRIRKDTDLHRGYQARVRLNRDDPLNVHWEVVGKVTFQK